MKNFLTKNKRILIDIAVLIGVFIFVFLAFFIFKPLYFTGRNRQGTMDGIVNRIFIYICIFAVIITGVILKIKNKLSIETLLFLIFLVGVLMQLNYMLITPLIIVSTTSFPIITLVMRVMRGQFIQLVNYQIL